jgi:subtilisin-like proprotein convertase family protein
LLATATLALLVAAPLYGSAAAKSSPTAERGKQAKKKQIESQELNSELAYERFHGAAPQASEKIEAPELGGQAKVYEVEPNGTTATANAATISSVMQGSISPNGDVDFWSFSATMGDRIYAGVMTSFTPSSSTNLDMQIIGTDGTTVVETDLDDGTFGTTSPGIAGATAPATGTYFVRIVNNSATSETFNYNLDVTVRSGGPTAEVEPNETTGTATPIPGSGGWVSGVVGPTTTDIDLYSIALNAGDSVFMSLDLDPERDATTWNGRLAFGLFDGFIIIANDASTTSPNSETYFWTVRSAGTYFIQIDPSSAGTGSATSTYTLSVAVRPATGGAGSSFTSTDVPKSIGPAIGTVTTSTLNVPTDVRIESLQLVLDIDMAAGTGIMQDLDVVLTNPQGNAVVVFDDVGSSTAGQNTSLNTVLDDDAAVPINASSVVLDGMRLQPDASTGHLDMFKGQLSAGTWTLTIYDDANAAAGGTLNSWGLVVYAEPALQSCGQGTTMTTVFSTDFEANDGGFTHSGTLDEWEYGTPNFAPITTANSGTKAWVTDLDGNYENSSSQDLFSPTIDLTGVTGPVYLSWYQKWQVENADFDKYFVEVRQAGQMSGRHVFDHTFPTPARTVSSTPSVNINGVVGWQLVTVDITAFAGQMIDVHWHLDSDTSVPEAGVAIDDVAVTACMALPAEKDTLGLYTPANAVFLKNMNTNGPADLAFGYGGTGDVAIAGDWNADGTDTIGVYRASTGEFFLRNSNTPGPGDITFMFGAPSAGLVPLAGDWNGDGTDTVGLYDPATGAFFLRNTNTTGSADIMFMFGPGGAGIRPLAGDWNGDGTDSIGIYVQASGVFFLRDMNSAGPASFAFMFGGASATYIPVVGDWNNDNTDSIGLYDSATGAVFLRNTSSSGSADIVFTFGSGGAAPLVGDWDNMP